MLGLILLYSFSFCFSKKCFISPFVINDNFTEQSILGYRFFPFSTSVGHTSPFWPTHFLQRNQLINLLRFPCNLFFVFLLLPLELSKFFHFNFYVLVWVCSSCLGPSDSCTWISVFFQVWKVFSHNFSKYIFDTIFSFFWNLYFAQVHTPLCYPIHLIHCFHFLFICLSVWCSD